MRKIIVLLLFLQVFLAQSIKFNIIETSDVHGNIFPYDFLNDKPSGYSLSQFSSFIKEVRSNSDVLLLDNGDFLQGTPAVYYSNFEVPERQNLYASVMNYLKYDAVTMGNHDIETGHNVYDKFVKEINSPVLAANAVNKLTGEPYFKPYFIINKSGIKIAVLGLITPAIPNWLPVKLWENMYFDDMIESAQKWIKVIKENENPDFVIGLFHAGVDPNYGGENENTKFNENASRLVAERVAGFDLILTGHDHKEWNFKVKNTNGDDVFIAGPAASVKSIVFCEVEMNYSKELKKWVKKLNISHRYMKDYKQDEEFDNRFKEEFVNIKNYVNKKVGQFTDDASVKEAFWGSNSFVDLIHKFQLENTDAEISFAAPLSFDSEIKKGDVFVRDMFKLYKYENFLYVMELTGDEIIKYLEYSYKFWLNTMKDENDYLLSYKKDNDGKIVINPKNNKPELSVPFYNYCSAAGINYTVDITKQPGERITIKSLTGGEKFDHARKYKVAVNSYRGNGGGGHLTKGAGIEKKNLAERILSSTDKDLRFYLMKWIEKNKIITPEKIDNWEIIPELYFQKAKEREKYLINNSKEN